ncbi:hypothetical protein JCM10450v2_007846 [Rhodotorula kratochvilovae]
MSSETTITILPTHLRLVHIPLARQEALMSRILDCWWFRRENDPFFALCHNNVELSLFADAAAVRRCFGEFMRKPEGANTPVTRKGKERAEEQEEDVLVGEELWVALEIAFGGNGWEEAAPRLHALTSPLAASNISILFVSTFFSDYVLVRASSLGLVTSILEHEGFSFAEADKAMEEELKGMRVREGEERAAGSGRSTRRSSRADGGGGGCRYGDVEDEDGLSDLVGSLVLSDAGSAGTVSGGGGRGPSSERPGPSRSPSFSLSRSNSLHLTTSIPTPTAQNPLSPAIDSVPVPPLSLLPDELVCVGLSPAHESQWRTKVVEALFFPERVLPRTSAASPAFSPATHTAPLPLPLSRQASLNRHQAQQRPESSRGGEGTPRPPPPARSASTALPTPLAPYPVPFVALTQTPDGTSLTADVRLLRALFPPREGEGDEMVFATGEAGLGGVWEGEEGLRGWEDEWEALRREEEARGEEGASSEESADESAEESAGESEADGEGWEAVSPSVGESALPSTDEEDDEEEDGEDPAGCTASDRTLLKCLQLDLMSFGLDKPGLVEHYAQVLINGGVRSLLYQSTYGSANILVAKRDVGRARRLLLRG